MNGTSTDNSWVEFIYAFQTWTEVQPVAQIPLDSTKNYTLSIDVISGTATNWFATAIRDASNVYSVNLNSTSKTFTGADGVYSGFISFGVENTFTDFTIGIQLEEKEYATKYEQYGIMPSPDFSSDVKMVKDNINIIINNGLETTDTNHKSQKITIPVQQAMLKGDGFIKVDGVWNEIHNWKKSVIDGIDPGNFYSYTQITSAIGSDLIGIVCSATGKKINGAIISENLSTKVLGSAIDTTNTENVRFFEGVASHTATTQIVFSLKKSRLNSDDINGVMSYLKSNNINVWYEVSNPSYVECTEEQIKELEKIEKLYTYKNITNICSTNEVSPILDIKYYKDLETIFEQQNSRLSAIEELLSATTTSAMLLDNIQSDLESEV